MPDPINDPANPPVDAGPEPQPAVGDPNPQPQPDTQPSPYDPDERVLNKLRTWQGRREKEFEDRITNRIADLLSRSPVQPPTAMTPATPVVAATEDPEPDVFTAPKEWFAWSERDKARKHQNAEQVYFGTLVQSSVRHQDDATHAAVMKELAETGHTQNRDPVSGLPCTPAVDAMLNYNRALRSVIEKKIVATPSPRNPLDNNPIPGPGLGSSSPGGSQNPTAGELPRNLSPQAQKLIRHSGWNADKVRQVLGNK